MDLGAIAVKAAMPVLSTVGKRSYNSAQLKKIATEAQRVLLTDKASTVAVRLGASEVSLISQYVNSAEFTQQMLRALICDARNYKEELRHALSAEISASIARRIEDPVIATDVVDVIEELIYQTVQALRSVVPNAVSTAYGANIAAQIAAASLRNSEFITTVTSLGAIDNFGRNLRAQVKSRHSKLKLANAVDAVSVEYGKLYVPPLLKRSLTGEQVSSIEAVFAQGLRAVILGDPGIGKSTLAAKLAFDLASDRVLQAEGYVPFLVVVRDHTSEIRENAETFLHYLEKTSRTYNLVPPPGGIEYILANRNPVVIVDGLDELGESAFRGKFADLLNSFANLFPWVRIIVTSRSVGYEEASLDSDLFDHYGIMPFDDKQVARYVFAWFKLNDARTAMGRAQSFLRESTSAHDLRSNSLLLSLLCVLYRTENYIPANRAQVYARCADLLFDGWDRSRGLHFGDSHRPYLHEAVQELAWTLYDASSGDLTISRSDAIAILADRVFSQITITSGAAEVAAKDFLKFCAVRAWVLTEVGSNVLEPVYGFAHKTFLEYFAAMRLVRQKPDPQLVWTKIKKRLGDASWEVLPELAVQILDKDYRGGAAAVFKLALEEASSLASVPDAINRRSRLLSFCCSCLNGVLPDNEVLEAIVRLSLHEFIVVPATDRLLEVLRGAPPDTVTLADEPLRILLEVSIPQNAERIARFLHESLLSAVREESPAGSAALLLHMLADQVFQGSASFGEVLLALLNATELPQQLTIWTKAFQGSRVPELDEARQLRILYGHVYALHVAVGSPAFSIFSTCLDLGEVGDNAVENDLESTYNFLTSLNISSFLEVTTIRSEWDWLTQSMLEKVRRLPPIAKGTMLILLLVPMSNRDVAYGLVGSWAYDLATARFEPARQAAAFAILNGLSLPSQAHDLVVDWLMAPVVG